MHVVLCVCMLPSSYGGKISAYMRFKYPNLVEAALAASAPIFLATGDSPSTSFYEIVTRVCL